MESEVAHLGQQSAGTVAREVATRTDAAHLPDELFGRPRTPEHAYPHQLACLPFLQTHLLVCITMAPECWRPLTSALKDAAASTPT